MKKIIKSILVVVLLVCFTTACTEEKKEEIKDAVRFKEEYESLNDMIREKDGKTIRRVNIPEDNPFVYKSAEELVDIINNKETFVVYFGFTDCPWCRSILPTLVEVANNLNVDKIYYVDVKEIRDELTVNEYGDVEVVSEGSEGYKKLLNLLSSVLDDYMLTDENGKKVDAKEKRIYAPNIVAVKNGVALKLTEGISDKQENGYDELTDEMKNDMYNDIECVLKCIMSDTNTCTKEKC